eukprot:11204581-Lingulodinium_polyedra.AAC.1
MDLAAAEKAEPPNAVFHEDPTTNRLRIFYGKDRKSTGLVYETGKPESYHAAVAHCLKWSWQRYSKATGEDMPYVFP